MSEDEKTKENKTEETKDAVDVNVALVIAERDSYKELAEDLAEQLDEMTKKYLNAEALIEEDSKAALIKEIAPLCQVPKSTLALKSVDELKEWKKVLGYAKRPVIKAGTPIKPIKMSAEAKLANMFHDYKEKTWGKDK
jgi:hypothetical protein